MSTSQRIFSCDFETTVYDGQTDTEVWASAVVELFTEDVQIFHSIEETLNYFIMLDINVVAYYHNLKFDGSFWLDYLMRDNKWSLAFINHNKDGTRGRWMKDYEMPDHSFKVMIAEMGQWYSTTLKINDHLIVFRDSLKILPFSVKEIGTGFKTKHQKQEMEYTGYRYAGCEITQEEQEYIANDVFVVKEALETLYKQGYTKITIGSNCLAEFKKTYDQEEYEMLFPNIQNIVLDKSIYGSSNAEEYIRNSYKGGWCYLVKGKENKRYKNGTTADVNSLYPSMMSSESGNEYPYGRPTFWKGGAIPDEAKQEHKYFFVRIKTRFYIRPNMLPFIQIKHSYMYKGNEALTSSDYITYDKKTKQETGRYQQYYDVDGNLCDTRITLTLTMTDYYLFLEHYEPVDFEILDGCYFDSKTGLFDEYVEKYKNQKINSPKGPLRQLAKLFLNNLYGKFASSDDSSFKKPVLKEDGSIRFYPIEAHDKQLGYIPVGSAITSYARNFTIRAAQKNFHGVDKPGFIYADTDSIHCDLPPDKIVGIKVHDVNFCCWKLESCWDEAIFARQKTYIEHVTHEDLKPVEEPYYEVKCAGMPTKCKELFVASMVGMTEQQEAKWKQEEKDWVRTNKNTLEDFHVGLNIPFGKLRPMRIKGGTLLVETSYKMR